MTVFTYRNFYGALRPVADVTIEANGTKFGTGMIIDSGADITMIPLRLGKALGFKEEIRDIENIRGISGQGVPYIPQQVKLTIGPSSFTAEVAWALTEDAPLLLGRKHVFTRFKITFDESERVTIFEPK